MNTFWFNLLFVLLIARCTLAIAVPLLKREHQRALAQLHATIHDRTQALQQLEATMTNTLQTAYAAKAVKSRFLALC